MAIIKVKTGGITADAITDALIADDVVGTEHLTANEVDTTALGADAVTGAQLADDAVNSEHYTDGSVDTAHIADAQITTAKLSTAVFTGATDIGADLADADLILVDDGAGGTIRKAALSRVKTYTGGGKLLQVVNAHTASTASSSSTTYADTNLTANITPSASSSKVLVLIQQTVRKSSGDTKGNVRVYRDSTEIGGTIAGREIADTDSTASNSVGTGFSYSYLDSPSSSSQLTYKTQFNNGDGTGTVAVNYSSSQSYMTLMEIAE